MDAPSTAQPSDALRWEQALQLLALSGRPAPAGEPGSSPWLQSLIDELVDLSSRDSLTGLANRRSFELALAREVDRVARSGEPALLLILDIDHFKRVNDTHGHGAGDALLREFGHLLRTRLRAEDIVCRYGGEEFVLIMPETTAAATLERAEALRTDTKSLTVRHYGQVLGAVTISIGVALYPDHGATGELVIRAADQALYRAKGDGRDCVRVAESD